MDNVKELRPSIVVLEDEMFRIPVTFELINEETTTRLTQQYELPTSFMAMPT